MLKWDPAPRNSHCHLALPVRAVYPQYFDTPASYRLGCKIMQHAYCTRLFHSVLYQLAPHGSGNLNIAKSGLKYLTIRDELCELIEITCIKSCAQRFAKRFSLLPSHADPGLNPLGRCTLNMFVAA